MNKLEQFIQENNELLAKNYKFCKENKLDHIIDDKLLKSVAEGGYVNDNGTFDGIEEGYKPYYEYLKYGNQYQEEEPIMIEDNYNNQKELIKMSILTEICYSELNRITKKAAKRYKEKKEEGEEISDALMNVVAKGAYLRQTGTHVGIDEGSKPYYDYLKYGNKPQQEEPIMIEDNNYNYETPYSFEYEPYLLDNNNYSITFDHEVDTSDSIQMIEELYNEDNNIEEDVDSNDIINIMDVLSNKISKVKETIIHYISNYRPIINQYTNTIEAILIE